MTVQPNQIGDPKAVKNSGPTFIAIRSGKHSSSTALSHARDFGVMMGLPEFAGSCKCEDGLLKPVVIITVDGGPDENPRYEKTIAGAINHFKTYDLDALFIATNAPGRSAYNRVERRMAPLSRDLAGLILDHEFFGSHLGDSGETIDVELERKNFDHAGNALAEIWSETVIDGCPVIAQYVPPENSESSAPEFESAEWKSSHVREGHYFLQVVKCRNRSCCKQPRSSYFNLLHQFIPAPMCVSQKEGLSVTTTVEENCSTFPSLFILMALDRSAYKKGTKEEVPFDMCCPSQKDLYESRICKLCGIYHGTRKSFQNHWKMCKKSSSDVPHPTLDVTSGRIRPLRIAARRQQEKMVVWTSRLNDEHVDWFDDNEIETGEQDESAVNVSDTIPVIDLDVFMNPVWTESDN